MVFEIKEKSEVDIPYATRLFCGLLDYKLGQGDELGGQYKTPPHLTIIEEMQKDREQHLQVHGLMRNDDEKKNRPKIEALSRSNLQKGSF